LARNIYSWWNLVNSHGVNVEEEEQGDFLEI